jgi:quinoprotein glucose dehydrogenase
MSAFRFSLLVSLLFSPLASGAEIAGTGSARGVLRPDPRAPEPHLQPATDEPRKVMAKFGLPAGFKADVWAAEPMLGNPVAFTIDGQGRVFTSETYRYRTSVLDIRHYMFMLEDDMACRTTDDRIAMSKRHFPNDWKELEKQTEIIRVIEDTKGAGRADSSRIYADGFNTMLDGIASGVLAHDGQVFFTNIPNLWRMTGLAADGRAEKKESLSFGYGVRFSFTGHDMHGLALGPDGRLYFSFGDRGAHVVTEEGKTLALPDEGAVFRCELDGSHLELVHRGLRNPQELAFDDYGNLFTGDNDCDQGDRERWVYIVEGGDSGWRVGWQHPPLGKERNMWLTEKLWMPREADTPAWVSSPILNIPDGPSGVVHNPGTGLPAEYDDAFFVCGFKGSSARSAISWWKVKPSGAGFAVERSPAVFVDNVQATDVDFGPDSRMYFSEWGEGWEGTGRGRIFKLEHAAARAEQAAQIAEVQRLLKEGFKQRSTDELIALLAHKDQRIRLRAQWALAALGWDKTGAPDATAFGERLLKVAAEGVESPRRHLSQLHAVWAVGQIARLRIRAAHPDGDFEIPPPPAGHPVLYEHPDAEVRAQALSVLAQLPGRLSPALAAIVRARLSDSAPRVRFHAALALAAHHDATSTNEVLAMLRANSDRDELIRHAGVMVLRNADASTLATVARDESCSVRLAAVLAMRRTEDAKITEFLSDSDPAIVQEAARAICDVGIVGGYGALAKLLNSPATDAHLLLRALNAAFRSGDAAAMAKFGADATRPEWLRLAAFKLLGTYATPPPRDLVVGTFRPLAPRDPQPAIVALRGVAKSVVFGKEQPVAIAAIGAMSGLEAKEFGPLLLELMKDNAIAAKVRGAALRALGNFDAAELPEAIKLALTDTSPALRVEASAMLGKLNPEESAQQLGAAFAGAETAEKQQILVALGNLKGAGAEAALGAIFAQFKAGQLPAEAQLELCEAIEKKPALAPLLADWQKNLPASDPLARYAFALAGGDREKGEVLFKEHALAQCLRCHKLGESGGDAGPDLTQIAAKKDRRYLLEAIVNPSATIAEGFQSVMVTMKSGDVQMGVVREETADTLAIQMPVPGAPLVTLQKSGIARREASAASGMPPGLGDMLPRRDLRDLLEFVAHLKE